MMPCFRDSSFIFKILNYKNLTEKTVPRKLPSTLTIVFFLWKSSTSGPEGLAYNYRQIVEIFFIFFSMTRSESGRRITFTKIKNMFYLQYLIAHPYHITAHFFANKTKPNTLENRWVYENSNFSMELYNTSFFITSPPTPSFKQIIFFYLSSHSIFPIC